LPFMLFAPFSTQATFFFVAFGAFSPIPRADERSVSNPSSLLPFFPPFFVEGGFYYYY
jgi:hypothetical protein